jgi:hypothetical protein
MAGDILHFAQEFFGNSTSLTAKTSSTHFLTKLTEFKELQNFTGTPLNSPENHSTCEG